jgi:uncharacterized RDD family membrane protein YckC
MTPSTTTTPPSTTPPPVVELASLPPALSVPPLLAPQRPVVELASLRRRLAGMLYEAMLLFGVLAFVWLAPWALILWVLDARDSSVWRGALILLHGIAVPGCYFVWYWHRHGQTLAMQTWRLQVLSAGGRRLSVKRAWLRYALAWLSLLPCGAGVLWALFDRDRQFLHDRLAGTRVVVLPK